MSSMWRWLGDQFGAAFMRETAVNFLTVFLAVELVVAAYYGVLDPDRLVSELIASGAIMLVAGLPAMWVLGRRDKRSEALAYRLKRLNDLDQMTGLLNTQAFLRDVQRLMAYMPVGTSAGAFAHIEVAATKPTGRQMEDYERERAIRVIATTIREATRSADLGVRLGERQFGIFLRDANGAKAAEITRRLLKEIALRQQQVGLVANNGTISIGIAAHRPGDSIRTAMQEAAQSLDAAAKKDAVVIHFRSVQAA
jgi:diguanylate cyclase (GGDEF)-like protein